MNCMICQSPASHYFTKHFHIPALAETEYEKCPQCGMVQSATHRRLPQEVWSDINIKLHASYQGTDTANGDPRWVSRLQAQSIAIARLYETGVLSAQATNALDYGCGDGKLGALLAKQGISINNYDKYMRHEGYLADSEVEGHTFPLVLNCSVLEHLRERRELDDIFNLVDKKNGIFGLHTLVCEEVPPTPEWFYLVSVHCAFYTNKSMDLLFRQYGFAACFYAVEAQMWFLCMNRDMVAPLKEACQTFPETWIYSENFIDYWKQMPYRS